MEATVDKFGRIVIPKRVRDDLGIKAGTVVLLEEKGQEVILRPQPVEPELISIDGVLVYSGTADEDITEAVRAHREKRIGKLAREGREGPL